jgi:hypothetical protein
MTLAYYAPLLYFAEKIVRRLFHNKIIPNETLTHFSPPKSPDKHKPHKHKEGETQPCEAHPFDTIHRLRLLKAVMTGKGEGFCGLHFKALQKRKALLAHYPLHDGVALASLADDWLSLHVMPWEQVRTERRERYRIKCPVYFDSYPALPPLKNTHEHLRIPSLSRTLASGITSESIRRCTSPSWRITRLVWLYSLW